MIETIKEMGEVKKAKRRGNKKEQNSKRTKSSSKSKETIDNQDEMNEIEDDGEEDQQEMEGKGLFASNNNNDNNNNNNNSISSVQILSQISHFQVSKVLKSLYKAIELNPLTNVDSKTHAIEVFADLTRFHSLEDSSSSSSSTSNSSNGRKKKSEENEEKSTKTINSIAYKLLLQLIDKKHGPREESFTLILKNLLPNVLMNFGGLLATGSLPKFMQNIKKQSIQFIV